MHSNRPNKPDAANPTMAFWLTTDGQWRRVADLERWAAGGSIILNMKRISFCIALVLFTGVALAASPQEQARFLKAIREAFTKKDGRAVVSLTCFDSVDAAIAESEKAHYSTNFPFPLSSYPISAVEYETPDPAPSATGTLEGKRFKWNLTVVKKVKIVYDTNGGKSAQILPVGEKDGKLFIPRPVTVQTTNSTSHP